MPDDNRELGDGEFPVVPADAGPTPTGPGLSSESPVQSTEPQSGASDGDGADTTESESLPEFPEEFKLSFEGLLYIGKLTDSFEWLGHRFVIHTVNTADTLEIGLLHRDHVGSLSDIKAYQALVVAACVESVDGRPLPQPLGPEQSALRLRFEYVTKWFPWTLDAIYNRYLLLEQTVTEVVNALGEASSSTAELIPT